MLKSLKSLSRRGSSKSGADSQPAADASSSSPPRLVPDAAQAARRQEEAAAVGSKPSGGSVRGMASILRSNSNSQGSGSQLVRPKASKPAFGADSAAAAAAAATAATPRGVLGGVGTGPIFLTVKPDSLVLRKPSREAKTPRDRLWKDRVLVLNAASGARATSLRIAIEEGDALGYEEEEEIMGVLGVVHLLSGPYLLTIDAAQPVGTLPPLSATAAGSTIYKVRRLGVRPFGSRQREQQLRKEPGWKAVDESRYLRLLRAQVASGALHFAVASASAPAVPTLLHRRVALQQQQQATVDAGAAEAAAALLSDGEYVWNAFALSGIEDKELRAQWGTPCISGFAASTPAPVPIAGPGAKTAVLTLVSRRSTKMQGTRFFRRGANAQGEVANGVETELIVALHPSSTTGPTSTAPINVLAHVQVRGSVPLPWAQTPDLSWQPPVTWDVKDVSSPSALQRPCVRHFDRLCEEYGGPVAAVNLIDSVGESRHSKAQAQLGVRFNEGICAHEVAVGVERERAKKGAGGGGGGGGKGGEEKEVAYTWFDFHKECAKLRWDRLELLISRIDGALAAQGWTAATATPHEPQRRQVGVVRTNCIDNLDRTNVVQSLVARRVLAKALGSSSVAAQAAPQLDRAFKQLWVANADALSRCYAGTPALKTDFVLTGKRTLLGALGDGVNAVTRYYVNNFWDGARQDAVALWLGDVRPVKSASKSPFGPYYRLASAPGGLLFTVSKGVQELAPLQLTLQVGSLLVETALGIAQTLLFLPDDSFLLGLLLAYLMWLLLWAALLECALTLGPFTTIKTLRRESWRLTDRPVLASLTGRPAPRAKAPTNGRK